jgi:hypothetical protein
MAKGHINTSFPIPFGSARKRGMEQGKRDVTDIDRLRGEGVSDMHTDVEAS